MITFDRVSLQFPQASFPAVNNCSFHVATGEFVVILGSSGCGKTTLLKMVNRLYEPTSGTIYLHGRDISQFVVTQLRQQIGYVIQQSGLFPHMTAAQNIGVVPRLLGWSKPQIQSRVDELLLLVDLPPSEYRHRYPAQLSGGQQQRVGLARALAGDPEVMLMDEPFGAIDAITRTALQDEILRLQRKLRKTILFVSHDVEEALKLADRILILQRGEILQYDTPWRILTEPANSFVKELVGADDIVRHLSLLRVATCMQPLATSFNRKSMDGKSTGIDGVGSNLSNPNNLSNLGNLPTIDRDSHLRHALSLLLKTGAEALAVIDTETPNTETIVGSIALKDIAALAQVNH